MSWATLFGVLIVNTIVTNLLGMFWYSMRGFGSLWIEYYYGSLRNFETRAKKHEDQTVFTVTVLSTLVYNFILLFLVNNIYSPRTPSDAILMSLVITLIHHVLEAPHIGFENRSYMALFVHTSYHYFQTLIPLLMIKFFFNLPTVSISVNIS